jgi:hypothetical protein
MNSDNSLDLYGGNAGTTCNKRVMVFRLYKEVQSSARSAVPKVGTQFPPGGHGLS